jgi:transposase
MVQPALAGTQKKSQREGRIIVWVDEAAFYLLAGVVRTYAPRGQTPILHAPLSRDHLSVISGITSAGRLLVHMQDHAYNGVDIACFLHWLWRILDSRLAVIWDGAPIHQYKAVKALLAETAGSIHLEQLPGYAPDLNPDESVWEQLKHVELANVVCHDQDELRRQLRRAIAHLRRRPDIIRGFIEHCGY